MQLNRKKRAKTKRRKKIYNKICNGHNHNLTTAIKTTCQLTNTMIRIHFYVPYFTSFHTANICKVSKLNTTQQTLNKIMIEISNEKKRHNGLYYYQNIICIYFCYAKSEKDTHCIRNCPPVMQLQPTSLVLCATK